MIYFLSFFYYIFVLISRSKTPILVLSVLDHGIFSLVFDGSSWISNNSIKTLVHESNYRGKFLNNQR